MFTAIRDFFRALFATNKPIPIETRVVRVLRREGNTSCASIATDPSICLPVQETQTVLDRLIQTGDVRRTFEKAPGGTWVGYELTY